MIMNRKFVVQTTKGANMRKGVAEGRAASIEFNLKALLSLESKGFKYVQIKGFSGDMHYDYITPQMLVLVPMKELPTDPAKKDIYEPIGSKLLHQWATEDNDRIAIVISNQQMN